LRLDVLAGFSDIQPFLQQVSADDIEQGLVNKTSAVKRNVTADLVEGESELNVTVLVDTTNATLVSKFDNKLGEGNPLFQAAAASVGQQSGVPEDQEVDDAAALDTLQELGVVVNRSEPFVNATVMQEVPPGNASEFENLQASDVQSELQDGGPIKSFKLVWNPLIMHIPQRRY
jgi:hypothetical protein